MSALVEEQVELGVVCPMCMTSLFTSVYVRKIQWTQMGMTVDMGADYIEHSCSGRK